MSDIKPLLDQLTRVSDPSVLRAVIGATLIAIEEHPTIRTTQKLQVYSAVALCLHDLADSIRECNCKPGEFCVLCEPRLRTTEGERE